MTESRFEMVPHQAMLIEDGGTLAIFECMTCGLKKAVASNDVDWHINLHNSTVTSIRHHVDEGADVCICCGRDTFPMLTRQERDTLRR